MISSALRTHAASTVRGDEAAEAELIERVEFLESEAKATREESDRLQTSLTISEAWVEELSRWLDETPPLAGAAPPDLPPIVVDWRALSLAMGAILAPWVVSGLFVLLVVRAL